MPSITPAVKRRVFLHVPTCFWTWRKIYSLYWNFSTNIFASSLPPRRRALNSWCSWVCVCFFCRIFFLSCDGCFLFYFPTLMIFFSFMALFSVLFFIVLFIWCLWIYFPYVFLLILDALIIILAFGSFPEAVFQCVLFFLFAWPSSVFFSVLKKTSAYFFSHPVRHTQPSSSAPWFDFVSLQSS